MSRTYRNQDPTFWGYHSMKSSVVYFDCHAKHADSVAKEEGFRFFNTVGPETPAFKKEMYNCFGEKIIQSNKLYKKCKALNRKDRRNNGPNKFFVRTLNKILRNEEKRELKKVLVDPDFDPVLTPYKKSAHWLWW